MPPTARPTTRSARPSGQECRRVAVAVDGQGHPPLSGVRPGPAAAAPPATAAASPARLAATGGLVMSQGPASPGSIGRRCIWSSPETRGDWALLPRTSSRRGGSPHTLLPWATAVEAARPSARLSAAPERRRRMLTKTTLHATIPISRTVSVVQQLSATAFYPHGFATMDKTLFVRLHSYNARSRISACFSTGA